MSLIHQVLSQYWGYNRFRPLQEEIIRSIIDGKDTLALLPTGGGKSICFQVPAMAMPGLCLVISPLIALMKDQEQQLRDKGIRAVAITSGMKKGEVELALNNCQLGDYKFLYVSPERLSSERFREALQEMKLNLIAVDEAHCISQWGYDFRPPYLQLAEIRSTFPDIPILALTASATPEVRKDICEKLLFKDFSVFTKSFARPNLSYLVRLEENKFAHLLKVLKNVPGTSIVYVRNRRKTMEIATELRKMQISADYYHAGLDHQTREERQQAWKKNATRVIVATNAFGMGIDKPDVRSVIHMDLPDDLESYYQEAGRGGRDEKPAYAVVLYDKADLADLEHRCIANFPEREVIRNVYKALSNFLQIPTGAGLDISYEFELTVFCKHYQFETLQTLNCLKILEMAGYISMSDAFYHPARVRILAHQMELYKFQVEQPAYDPLVKGVLRSYAGTFDDYVRFSETELSRRTGIEVEELKKQFIYLTKIGILDYIPVTMKPSVTFLHRRVPEGELYIPKEILEQRKLRFRIRADAFRNFLINPHQCRSILLLSYFGEKNLQRCGTCDFCRERNKLALNDMEVETLSEKIHEVLQLHPLIPAELSKKIPDVPVDKLEPVLRWLLDTGDLGLDFIGRLYVKSE
ncbi:MAG: RecQ family ATP-dependent DNA helicase [Bacteroidetes bacterium]|nr:RecQ family ATP-dependent DNA helicase [Bacteroidota bacterium]